MATLPILGAHALHSADGVWLRGRSCPRYAPGLLARIATVVVDLVPRAAMLPALRWASVDPAPASHLVHVLAASGMPTPIRMVPLPEVVTAPAMAIVHPVRGPQRKVGARKARLMRTAATAIRHRAAAADRARAHVPHRGGIAHKGGIARKAQVAHLARAAATVRKRAEDDRKVTAVQPQAVQPVAGHPVAAVIAPVIAEPLPDTQSMKGPT